MVRLLLATDCNFTCSHCSERKNVNLPGVNVDLPTLTDKDIDDLVNWVREERGLWKGILIWKGV